jgi:hypothetical protein
LYKRYDEKLLIAIAFYANNELFPLAFAIVDEENNSKWRWFLLCLQRYMISDMICICIISDKYIDINNVIAKVWHGPIEYH